MYAREAAILRQVSGERALLFRDKLGELRDHTFTYVNFVLVRPPLSLAPMTLGLVYLVFAPSIVTTLLAGRVARLAGTKRTLWLSFGLAGAGLPLLLLPSLSAVLAGMVMVGVGTFFAQAAATGFVSATATSERGSASGIYLACYFFGGMVGTAVLGAIFDSFGWAACVAGIAAALAVGGALAGRLEAVDAP
jgi:MFS family permease